VRWVKETMEVMEAMVRSIRPGKATVTSIPPVTGLTEYAAWLTMTGRTSFRRAHYLCGKVASMLVSGMPFESVEDFLRSSKLDEEAVSELKGFLNPEKVLGSYAVTGSAREEEVRRMVVGLRRECEELRSWAEERLRVEEECRKRLLGFT
jgi:argininosuccinate lyase